jgi:5-methyltetrahydrofolate--homocysteine methyltransferase
VLWFPPKKSLKKQKKHNVDVIGLSGLITPSLDEMVHFASEMERLGLELPLLIGGATTSRIHTAVKIAPVYSGPVIHVLDASRSVPVVSKLTTKSMEEDYKMEIKLEYDALRESHNKRTSNKKYLSFSEAKENKTPILWSEDQIAKPVKPGITVFDDFPLEKLREYIDWTPFFITWQLTGKYPAILEDEVVGTEAKKLFDDANEMLDDIIKNKKLTAKGVIGIFPANADDEDVIIFEDETRTQKAATFHMLRQQTEKRTGQANKSLSDFVAPLESGLKDYMGGFAVTAGIGIEKMIEQYEKEQDDYSSIMTKALADRLAEAFAECMHAMIRQDFWGYAPDEKYSNDELIKESYRGIRPAPGYPACPDHTEKRTLFDLLQVEKKIGIELTESFAMYPAASVSGFYFAHPESTYFSVGKISEDQVIDYSDRKSLSKEVCEKWLSPILAYEPEKINI